MSMMYGGGVVDMDEQYGGGSSFSAAGQYNNGGGQSALERVRRNSQAAITTGGGDQPGDGQHSRRASGVVTLGSADQAALADMIQAKRLQKRERTFRLAWNAFVAVVILALVSSLWGQASTMAAMQKQLDRVNAQMQYGGIATGGPTPTPAGTTADLAAIVQRLDVLEASMQSMPGDLAALDGSLTSAQATLNSRIQAVETRTTAAEGRLAAAEGRLATNEAAVVQARAGALTGGFYTVAGACSRNNPVTGAQTCPPGFAAVEVYWDYYTPGACPGPMSFVWCHIITW